MLGSATSMLICIQKTSDLMTGTTLSCCEGLNTSPQGDFFSVVILKFLFYGGSEINSSQTLTGVQPTFLITILSF